MSEADSSAAAPLGRRLLAWVPAPLKRRLSVTLKARGRALLGIEPWPDLAVRHPLFREECYRRLRADAAHFDVEKPNKPALERGHQTSYLLARWLANAGVKTAFQVGYANGRYLFYLSRMGIACGGTDLPERDSPWTSIPRGALDETVERRLLELDFFALTPGAMRAGFDHLAPLDVLFTEATFETLLPWRASGVSVPKYAALDRERLDRLCHEALPAKLAELAGSVRNILLIEPEPDAGGAGAVFETCARRLPDLGFGVWRFWPPFDRLFRLSPGHPTEQTVYAYVRDPVLTDVLGAYARRIR